jgi:hypothetical protein
VSSHVDEEQDGAMNIPRVLGGPACWCVGASLGVACSGGEDATAVTMLKAY